MCDRRIVNPYAMPQPFYYQDYDESHYYDQRGLLIPKPDYGGVGYNMSYHPCTYTPMTHAYRGIHYAYH